MLSSLSLLALLLACPAEVTDTYVTTDDLQALQDQLAAQDVTIVDLQTQLETLTTDVATLAEVEGLSATLADLDERVIALEDSSLVAADLEPYATDEDLAALGVRVDELDTLTAQTSSDLALVTATVAEIYSDYLTSADQAVLDSAITALQSAVNAITSDYLTSADEAALTSAIDTIQAAVDAIAGDYLTSADEAALASAIDAVQTQVDAIAGDYLTSTDDLSLLGYATEQWVTDHDYATLSELGDAEQDLSDAVDAVASDVGQLQSDTDGVADLLQYLAADTTNHEVVFTGANVLIQSGSEASDEGCPDEEASTGDSGDTGGVASTCLTGLGNLIIGYDEDSGDDDKTGSHNLVVGPRHTYDSYGGVVFGDDNAISGPWAGVLGGDHSVASGDAAVVIGGSTNTASGLLSVVLGGSDVQGIGEYSVAAGGQSNEASGNFSTVVGGYQNAAATTAVWGGVFGGELNAANESYTVASGGYNNTAGVTHASVLGGEGGNVSAGGDFGVVVGGYYNAVNTDAHGVAVGGYQLTAAGAYALAAGGGLSSSEGAMSSVVGSYGSTASGDQSGAYGAGSGTATDFGSGVFGGDTHTSSGYYSTAVGGYGGSAGAKWSTVLGGSANEASDECATVSGGRGNVASGVYSSVSGGDGNHAVGSDASVSGGYQNTANGDRSTVAGGSSGTADGDYSAILGGELTTATAENAVVVDGHDVGDIDDRLTTVEGAYVTSSTADSSYATVDDLATTRRATHDALAIASYHLDRETGDAVIDWSGNGGPTGLITDATWSGSGVSGGALEFDNTQWQYVDLGTDVSFDEEITVEAWIMTNGVAVNTAGDDDYQVVAGQYYDNGDATNAAYVLELRPDLEPQFSIGGLTSARDATLVTAGTWTHLVGTYDGSTIQLFVDGVLADSVSAPGALNTTTAPLYIGAHDASADQNTFNGLIDEVRFYDRALSADEVAARYADVD